MGGDAFSFVAFVMYAVFAILMPTLHVVLLAAALANNRDRSALAAANAVSKLCMLDVSIMGAVVVTCAMSDLRKDGVVVSLSDGIVPLLAAELCRYSIAHIVSSVAENGEDDTACANRASNTSDANELEEGAVQSAVSEAVSTVSSDFSVTAASTTVN